MPFSKSDNVPFIIDKVAQISNVRAKKLKILDIGCGWGKWGHLLRGWLDVEKCGPHKKEWENIIDAVEIFEPYITPAHIYIYDDIKVDDFRNLFQDSGKFYDLIIMGDCLEHVTMPEGKDFIQRVSKYCNYLIVSVPGYKDSQKSKLGNPAEEHKAWWCEHDFRSIQVEGVCDAERTGKLITAVYKFSSKTKV